MICKNIGTSCDCLYHMKLIQNLTVHDFKIMESRFNIQFYGKKAKAGLDEFLEGIN